MDGFVWDMLRLTKDYQPVPKKTNLAALFEELRSDLVEKVAGRDFELDFQVEDGFPEVDLDARSMYRALLNLVKNAIEACNKERSYVRVRARSKDDRAYEIVY